MRNIIKILKNWWNYKPELTHVEIPVDQFEQWFFIVQNSYNMKNKNDVINISRMSDLYVEMHEYQSIIENFKNNKI